jgi:hypothetical protein
MTRYFVSCTRSDRATALPIGRDADRRDWEFEAGQDVVAWMPRPEGQPAVALLGRLSALESPPA